MFLLDWLTLGGSERCSGVLALVQWRLRSNPALGLVKQIVLPSADYWGAVRQHTCPIGEGRLFSLNLLRVKSQHRMPGRFWEVSFLKFCTCFYFVTSTVFGFSSNPLLFPGHAHCSEYPSKSFSQAERQAGWPKSRGGRSRIIATVTWLWSGGDCKALQGTLQVPVLLLQGDRPVGCRSSATICSPWAFLMLHSLLS